MKSGKQVFALAALACTLVIAGAMAAEKVQGVKWRARVTMQTASIAIPERMVDVCLPATDPDQAAMQQGQQGNCKMSNYKRSGNKTTADVKCTGERPSETHWEMEQKGDSMQGSMVTRTAGNTINMKYDYTRVGGACEIQQAPAAGAMPQGAMTQEQLQEQLKKLREQLGR